MVQNRNWCKSKHGTSNFLFYTIIFICSLVQKTWKSYTRILFYFFLFYKLINPLRYIKCLLLSIFSWDAMTTTIHRAYINNIKFHFCTYDVSFFFIFFWNDKIVGNVETIKWSKRKYNETDILKNQYISNNSTTHTNGVFTQHFGEDEREPQNA